ncbi:MAG: hypothetical protein QOJ43_42 [Gaiellaceae bacterium]|jgi:hypothetical protein|nr:hypothetical protein [Gaiellaceae bacterium]
MSLMDKIKSFFTGGASASDSHAGHDHSGHDHAEPAAPVDPAGIPASEPEDTDSEARA